VIVLANSAEALADLRQRIGGLAVGLLSREGTIRYAEMPVGTHPDTFGVMLATVFGAATTANAELGLPPPDRVLVAEDHSITIILPVGATGLLVTVVATSADVRKAIAEAARFADYLGSA
jgi:predicted regulator of Ras-like GTPase activity (Roadblock/LC7/MglB family)